MRKSPGRMKPLRLTAASMTISIGAALLALLACGSASTGSRVPAFTENALRAVEGRTVTSSALPRLIAEVEAPFRYLGRVPFTIRNIAAGERFVFADLEGKQIRRMVVLQFEGFLPHSEGIYRYDFSEAREMAGFLWLDDLEAGTHRWRALATQLESRALNAFTVHPLPVAGAGPPA